MNAIEFVYARRRRQKAEASELSRLRAQVALGRKLAEACIVKLDGAYPWHCRGCNTSFHSEEALRSSGKHRHACSVAAFFALDKGEPA